MLKRLLDFFISLIGLIIFSPIILGAIFFVLLSDFGNPIYTSYRVGQNKNLFRMYKIRSMVVNAENKGGSSSSNSDQRITAVGKVIRAIKLDEISQLWNVLVGDMSLVGPRPNVLVGGIDMYTQEENRLLEVKPGITDFSSIVFSDEGKILANHPNADLAYNQLIRPWKSYMGLFYVDNASFNVDCKLIILTILAIFSPQYARSQVAEILHNLEAPPEIVEVATRIKPLVVSNPPGRSTPVNIGELIH